MIVPESNGDFVSKLFHSFVKITMDKFWKLMVSEITSPERSSKLEMVKNEIISPTSDLLRSKSRKFYQRKSLQFDTIMEISENQIEYDVSSIDSEEKSNKSNSSFDKNLENTKIYMINQRPVYSSPKLSTSSHFEDSGFSNNSIDMMTSRLETISEVQDDKFSTDEISFDSYLQREEDEPHSWLKVNENSPVNSTLKEYSTKYYSESVKPLDKFIADIKNVCDIEDGIEMISDRNESVNNNY